MLARTLELIDAKRAALKLPAYDPAQFGDSGDTPYFAAIRDYLAEHDRGDRRQRRALTSVGAGTDARGHAARPRRRRPRATVMATARRPDVALHRHPRHPRRAHASSTRPSAGRGGPRRARPRDAGRLHQHRLLPAGDLRLHRHEGREARRPAGGARAGRGAAAPGARPTRCGCPTWARRSTAGIATLFAEEAIEGVRFARGTEPQIVHVRPRRGQGALQPAATSCCTATR